MAFILLFSNIIRIKWVCLVPTVDISHHCS